MMPFLRLEVEFFEQLKVMDERLSATVAAARCRHCAGPLHRANYPRKPRGGLLCGAGEQIYLRQSLCCGKRGCRKRALPPSLLFLGRRVYVGALVVIASAIALLRSGLRKAENVSGVPVRTLVRWRAWWKNDFAASLAWAELRACFAAPAPRECKLPLSMLHRVHIMQGRDPPLAKTMMAMARHLATVTTSLPQTTQFVRDVFRAPAEG